VSVPLRIRLADPERDAAGIAAIYAPAVERSSATFEEVTPSPGDMADRIVRTLERSPWLVAEEDDPADVVGYACAALHRERAGYRWSVDISVYVRADHRGRGTGRALYEVLLPMLQRQRFVNVFAGIALPNAASVAIHEAIGMRRIAVYEGVGFKFDAWHDVAWYGLRMAEPGLPLAEPVSLPELLSTAV
jgi:phosphinothricin acetyltransferase